MKSFEVTGLWWLWVVTTLPITAIAIVCWYWWKQRKEKANEKPVQSYSKAEGRKNEIGSGRKLSVVDMLRKGSQNL